jgi:hypothetical protein
VPTLYSDGSSSCREVNVEPIDYLLKVESTMLVKIAINATDIIIEHAPPVSDSYYGYYPNLKAAG